MSVVRAGKKKNFVRGKTLRMHHQAFSIGFKNICTDRSYKCKSSPPTPERYISTLPVCSSDHAVPTAAVCSDRAHSYKVNWCLLYPNRKTVRHANAQFYSFCYSFLPAVKQFLPHFLLKLPVSLRTFGIQIILKHIPPFIMPRDAGAYFQ